MKVNLLYVLIPTAIFFCYYITKDLQNQSEYNFFGFAETDSRTLNLDVDVVVDRLLVSQGNFVRTGDTLAIFYRREYDRDSIQYSENYLLEDISNRNKQKLLDNEKDFISIQSQAEIGRIQSEISIINFKDSIEQSYRSLIYPKAEVELINSTVKLEALENQIRELSLLKNQKLKAISDEKNANQLLSINKNQQRNRIYNFDKSSKEKLILIAPISGYVDQVSISPNISYPAYKDIMRINPKNPSKIIGFIHESSDIPFNIGDSVSLVSSVRSDVFNYGKIVSVSPKLVELPLRLRKFIEVRSWGREVFIHIPESSNFYIGERITISIKPRLND